MSDWFNWFSTPVGSDAPTDKQPNHLTLDMLEAARVKADELASRPRYYIISRREAQFLGWLPSDDGGGA